MKTFRYEKGHVAGETLTVQELKDKLDEYPGHMPVMCTWEGVTAYVEPEAFDIEVISKGMKEDEEFCLVINVNGY